LTIPAGINSNNGSNPKTSSIPDLSSHLEEEKTPHLKEHSHSIQTSNEGNILSKNNGSKGNGNEKSSTFGIQKSKK
jgi:hypothetical protein